mmetsp:Transcript_135/g.317  ORF Transcript_135/g.317 Transcript_135/m.317 type:complete len:209 (-) Transcript_135:1311-1937(-)
MKTYSRPASISSLWLHLASSWAHLARNVSNLKSSVSVLVILAPGCKSYFGDADFTERLVHNTSIVRVLVFRSVELFTVRAATVRSETKVPLFLSTTSSDDMDCCDKDAPTGFFRRDAFVESTPFAKTRSVNRIVSPTTMFPVHSISKYEAAFAFEARLSRLVLIDAVGNCAGSDVVEVILPLFCALTRSLYMVDTSSPEIKAIVLFPL